MIRTCPGTGLEDLKTNERKKIELCHILRF